MGGAQVFVVESPCDVGEDGKSHGEEVEGIVVASRMFDCKRGQIVHPCDHEGQIRRTHALGGSCVHEQPQVVAVAAG